MIYQATGAVIVITKVVAKPILIADESLSDTPKNGHMPKKYFRTKLFTSTVAMKTKINSFTIYYFFSFLALTALSIILTNPKSNPKVKKAPGGVNMITQGLKLPKIT